MQGNHFQGLGLKSYHKQKFLELLLFAHKSILCNTLAYTIIMEWSCDLLGHWSSIILILIGSWYTFISWNYSIHFCCNLIVPVDHLQSKVSISAKCELKLIHCLHCFTLFAVFKVLFLLIANVYIVLSHL